MESTSQQPASTPCPCQQQFVDALPWLAIAFAIIVVLDRWSSRRRKKNDAKSVGAAASGSVDGGKS